MFSNITVALWMRYYVYKHFIPYTSTLRGWMGGRGCTSSMPPPAAVIFSQALDLATIWYSVDWWITSWFEYESSVQITVISYSSLQLISHYWMCTIHLKVLFCIHQSFVLLMCFPLSDKHSKLVRSFTWNIFWDVMIFWSWSGDWQLRTLKVGLNCSLSYSGRGVGSSEFLRGRRGRINTGVIVFNQGPWAFAKHISILCSENWNLAFYVFCDPTDHGSGKGVYSCDLKSDCSLWGRCREGSVGLGTIKHRNILIWLS